MIGVIDRIEGDRLVVVLDDETEFSVPRAEAPTEMREGLAVHCADGKILAADEEETARRLAAARARLDRLRNR